MPETPSIGAFAIVPSNDLPGVPVLGTSGLCADGRR